ncbi:hypothetical protein GOP47_0029800 [Adiantum capillus-veneris]|nr:hypothetical protein GOP47_0029800 [Adiantum capillus-veneris]
MDMKLVPYPEGAAPGKTIDINGHRYVHLEAVVHVLDLNGYRYTYPAGTSAQLNVTFSSNSSNSVDVTADGNDIVGVPLVPLPEVTPADVHLLHEMMDFKLSVLKFELRVGHVGLRLDHGKLLPHRLHEAPRLHGTGLPTLPLDMPTIAEMIFESNWGNYTPHNPDFMHSLLMCPPKRRTRFTRSSMRWRTSSARTCRRRPASSRLASSHFPARASRPCPDSTVGRGIQALNLEAILGVIGILGIK